MSVVTSTLIINLFKIENIPGHCNRFMKKNNLGFYNRHKRLLKNIDIMMNSITDIPKGTHHIVHGPISFLEKE